MQVTMKAVKISSLLHIASEVSAKFTKMRDSKHINAGASNATVLQHTAYAFNLSSDPCREHLVEDSVSVPTLSSLLMRDMSR